MYFVETKKPVSHIAKENENEESTDGSGRHNWFGYRRLAVVGNCLPLPRLRAGKTPFLVSKRSRSGKESASFQLTCAGNILAEEYNQPCVLRPNFSVSQR